MSRIRVLLADDHRLFRAGIRSLLQTLGDIEVVAEAGDGREAIRLAGAHRPDVVLLDIFMPGLNGLDAAARIARDFPRTRVIMLSMNADEDSVLKTLRPGPPVTWSRPPIRPSWNWRCGLSCGARSSSARRSRSTWSQPALDGSARNRPRWSLTPRHREVLQLIAEGQTTKKIAKELDVSVKTAESYCAELMKALDIHDVASLTRYAIRTGLVSLDP